MSLSLKECVLFQCVSQFENVGFMEWHARVLSVLSPSPQSLRVLARKTGLFQYHVRGIVQDLLGLGLIEYTRYGVQFKDPLEMIHRLVECAEEGELEARDFEAAFEVVTPRVLALKSRYNFVE